MLERKYLGNIWKIFQLFPSWDSRKFAELEVGSPASLERREERKEERKEARGVRGGLRVRGTPACPGCVEAQARVVTHISQAERIRPGDILVTHSTGQSAGGHTGDRISTADVQISAGAPTFPSWPESSQSWVASSLTAPWWPGSTACPAWWGPRPPRKYSVMEKLSVWTPLRVLLSGLTRTQSSPASETAGREICLLFTAQMKYSQICVSLICSCQLQQIIQTLSGNKVLDVCSVLVKYHLSISL